MNQKKSQSRFHYGWVIVAVSLIIQTILYGSMYSYSVFFKHVADGLDLTRTEASGVIAVAVVAGGLFGIVVGRLSDKFGPKKVVLLFAFIAGLGYMLISRVNSLLQLYLFFGLAVAVGRSAGYTPILSTVARWFEKKRRLALGIVAAGMGLGIMLVLPLANHLISLYGWRTAYILIAVMIWVVVIPCSLLLRRSPREMGLSAYGEDDVAKNSYSANTVAKEEEGFSLSETLRIRSLWMLFSLFALCGFGAGMILFQLVNHATDVGISKTTAALFMTIIGGASIAGMIAMGYIADKIRIKRALVVSLALMAIPMLFFCWSEEHLAFLPALCYFWVWLRRDGASNPWSGRETLWCEGFGGDPRGGSLGVYSRRWHWTANSRVHIWMYPEATI